MNKSNTPENLGSLNPRQRVRIAITLTGMKVNEFCMKANLPKATVWSWMNGSTPLTLKGAMRLSDSLSIFDILCTPEWLLTGQGLPPNLLQSRPCKKEDQNLLDSHLTHELSIFREIEFFKSFSPRYSVMGIRDDSMLPFYNQGDFVGGYKLDNHHFSKGIHMNCIVETLDGLRLVRRLDKGNKKGLYNLSALNLSSKAQNMFLLNVELQEVSIIIWHRKKNL